MKSDVLFGDKVQYIVYLWDVFYVRTSMLGLLQQELAEPLHGAAKRSKVGYIYIYSLIVCIKHDSKSPNCSFLRRHI